MTLETARALLPGATVEDYGNDYAGLQLGRGQLTLTYIFSPFDECRFEMDTPVEFTEGRVPDLTSLLHVYASFRRKELALQSSPLDPSSSSSRSGLAARRSS